MQKYKKILVVGAGLTGCAILKYFAAKPGFLLYFWDEKEPSFSASDSKKVDLTPCTWLLMNYIFISPGVDISRKDIRHLLDFASSNGCIVTNDIQFFCKYLKKGSKSIGVTGTNGKSTTTLMIDKILKDCGVDTEPLGNVGKPALEFSNKDLYVLELSSFQLEICKSLPLKIAVMLSITKDHLDRHKNFKEYKKAKAKIFENPDTIAIASIDQEANEDIFKSLKNKIKVAISTSKLLKKGFSIIDNNLFEDGIKICKISNQISHQKENIIAAYACCRILKMEASAIVHSIEEFKPLEHRMEFVARYKNIKFFNDSKATNPDSAKKALECLQNVYWLAGGSLQKGLGDHPISLGNAKKAYFFGDASKELSKIYKSRIRCQDFDKMQEALFASFKDANSGKEDATILLSPSLSSFDQFKNFEERGRSFKNLVFKIIKECSLS